MSDPIIATNLDTPLMIAARNGEVSALNELIASGVAIDAVDKDHRTAFIHASIRGEFDTAKLLFIAGADINARDLEGRTAAHYIILCRSSGRSRRFLQQLLVKNGANLSVCDASGFTPLMLCAKSGYFKLISHGRPDLAEILIKAGVDVNFRNAEGLTALLVGAADCNYHVCAILIGAGAGPKSPHEYDWTATIEAFEDGKVRAKFTAMLVDRALCKVTAEEFAKADENPDAPKPGRPTTTGRKRQRL